MPPKHQPWVGPTSAPQLLGDLDDNDVIGSSPMYVRRDTDSDGVSYTAVIQKKIDKTGLLALLKGASPAEQGMTEGGIDADWRMPDEIANYPNSKRLLKIHESGLGKAWQIFERYRRLFLAVLDAGTTAPFIDLQGRKIGFKTGADLTASFEAEAKGIARREEVVAMLRALLKDRRSDMLALLNNWHIRKKARGNKRNGKMDFERWTKSGLRKFFDVVKRSVDPDFSHDLMLSYLQNRFATMQHPASGETIYVDKRSGDAQILAKAQSCEIFFDRGHKGKVEFVGLADHTVKTIVHLLDEEHDKMMYALLQWRRNDSDGSRHWNYDVPDEKRINSLSSVMDGKRTEPQRFNPLAGLLALSTIGSRHIVESWPKEMGLPHSKTPQTMSSAQAPVLAPLHDAELLQESPLLPALERFVDEQRVDEVRDVEFAV